MWKCHKCGKPVYFAERKQSLGYNWHPECLRCEECGKRLNPGQHAEHKGVPYCHVPCYGALFGPQLFGHGTRVESHKSFGQPRDILKVTPSFPWTQLEAKLKTYNQFFEGKSGEIRSRQVNGRLILEGSLRIYWGVQGVIHLKENDDQRTVVTVRKRNSCRLSTSSSSSTSSIDQISDSQTTCDNLTNNLTDLNITNDVVDDNNRINDDILKKQHDDIIPKSVTLPSKLVDVKNLEWDELDELLQVERKISDSDKLYQTMPIPVSITTLTTTVTEQIDDHNDTKSPIIDDDDDDDDWLLQKNHLNRSMSGPDSLNRIRTDDDNDNDDDDEVVLRRPRKTGSTAIRRRPGRRLSRSKVKRRCSINGHFYDRETSFFTPPHGSQMSVWITSLVNTQEVINLMLEKYKVDSDANNFALFVVRDNGEQRRLKDDEYPLLTRVLLGPHEDVAKLYLMDSHSTCEVSSEVAQFLNLSLAECRAILNQYYSQEEREVARIKDKFTELKRRILVRLEEMKSHHQ